MQTVSEITVIAKNDEQTFKQKFLSYEIYSISPDDKELKKYVDETLANSKILPESVTIKITLRL